MTHQMNITQNTQPSFDPAAPVAAQRYGTEHVDFGTKYASNIKDAYKNDEPWAVAIVDAERAPIAQPKALSSRGFGKNNLYGAMHAGLRVATKFSSPDPTVRETLQQWARNLNHDFGPMKSYTPDQIAQRAVDLNSVCAVLAEGLTELASSAEIGNEDIAAWRKILEGLESYADAAEHLHQVLAKGPGIDTVYLDVEPKRY